MNSTLYRHERYIETGPTGFLNLYGPTDYVVCKRCTDANRRPVLEKYQFGDGNWLLCLGHLPAAGFSEIDIAIALLLS